MYELTWLCLERIKDLFEPSPKLKIAPGPRKKDRPSVTGCLLNALWKKGLRVGMHAAIMMTLASTLEILCQRQFVQVQIGDIHGPYDEVNCAVSKVLKIR